MLHIGAGSVGKAHSARRETFMGTVFFSNHRFFLALKKNYFPYNHLKSISINKFIYSSINSYIEHLTSIYCAFLIAATAAFVLPPIVVALCPLSRLVAKCKA